jgi:CheY-like chemotaxis protein
MGETTSAYPYSDLVNSFNVMVVENDVHFRELLESVLTSSDAISSVMLFDSVESFLREKNKQNDIVSWLPDVLVMDVMSSADIRFDGASYANALRSDGARCAVVLISSLDVSKVIKVFSQTNPGGWRALQKTSRLSSAEIITAVIDAVEEMKLK